MQTTFVTRLGLAMAAVFAVGLLAPLSSAQDRISGGEIRDRIRERIEKRRIERAPAIGSARKVPGASPGQDSIVVSGVTRTFVRFTPNAVLLAGKRAPVVVALHGGNGSADKLQSYLGLNALAEREGFIVVYPQGIDGTWNDGREASVAGKKTERSEGDDVAFLNALSDSLVVQGVADPKRLYLMGLSNGGFMTLRMACEEASRFAAFAPVIASMPLSAKATCKPGRARPVILINGMDDPLVRYDGAPGKLGLSGNFPVPELASFLATLNGCSKSSDAALPDRDPQDGTSVSQRTFSGCNAGGDVQLYSVQGGGHQPPVSGKSTPSVGLDATLGPRSRDIDTGQTVWDFFKRQSF
jgi:polyhydroxybutyrate depolymerase